MQFSVGDVVQIATMAFCYGLLYMRVLAVEKRNEKIESLDTTLNHHETRLAVIEEHCRANHG